MSDIIGVVTTLLLLAGYSVDHIAISARAKRYLETAFLSLTAFLLMIRAMSEILRGVPEGHPIVTDPKSPLQINGNSPSSSVIRFRCCCDVQARQVVHASGWCAVMAALSTINERRLLRREASYSNVRSVGVSRRISRMRFKFRDDKAFRQAGRAHRLR